MTRAWIAIGVLALIWFALWRGQRNDHKGKQ